MSLPEIWMKGDFNMNTALELRKQIIERAEMGQEVPIVIYINSYGGQVDALMSILDTIDSVPNKVVTVCAGTAMSCGAVLLAYGDERYMGANSRAMIHQVSSGTFGTNNEIIATAKEIDKLNSRLAKILADKIGISYEEIMGLYENNIDKYFTAKEAKKFGLVDHIGVPTLKITQTVTYEVK